MKLRDTVLEEVGKLSTEKLFVVHQILTLIQQEDSTLPTTKLRSRTPQKARNILSKCRISLSKDIVDARKERV